MMKMNTNTFISNTLKAIIILTIMLCNHHIFSQKVIPAEFCINTDEKVLFNQLNQLIDEYGKTELELSASLSYVASIHVEDLLHNRPDTSVCNLSSWSDKGEWTACCHNPYVPKQDCMWDKPKELTTYPYRGYELASYFEDGYTLDSVMKLWTTSKEVLDMILTEGNFKKKKWICMGIGINNKYVSVWFGQRSDKVKPPGICSDSANFVATNSHIDVGMKFYVVFGSYSSTKDAKEALKKLVKDGFDKADLLKGDDTIRVYLDSFSTIKEAMFFKQNLAYTYREAWVYKE